MKYHRIAFLIIAGILPFILWTCVDVNNANVPSSINYRSLIRFVNLAGDNPAAGAITADNAPVGTITYGNATGYLNLPAGSRTLGYSGMTQLVSFTTDDQYTVIVHTLNNTDRFLLLDEGYTFKNYSIDTMTQIKFINSAVGFASTLIFRQDSLNGTTVADAVPYAKGQSYIVLTPGNYAFFVISNGEYHATIDGAQSVPPVVTSSNGTGTFGLSVDSLPYLIQIQSYNTGGVSGIFFTAAHFHLGALGVNGPIEHAIDVSGQTVTFPDGSLIPVDTLTKASGSASGFVLSANAARDSFQLKYTISVTADPTDTVLGKFLDAQFRLGSVSGPIVGNIRNGPFLDSTITGKWTTGDAQSLTPALTDSLLNGRIFITFRTPRHPADGELSLQLHPDPSSTNTFTGTWTDIPDSIKNSIVAGDIYVNFHTLTNPNGQIRGQLVVDPAGGNFGITSLPVSAYNAGAMYTIVAADSGSTTLKLFAIQNHKAGTATVAQKGNSSRQTVGQKNPK